MPLSASGFSAELLAAQTQLIQLRESIEKNQPRLNRFKRECIHGRQKTPQNYSTSDILKKLPPHLGWSSHTVTAVVRAKHSDGESAKPFESPDSHTEFFPETAVTHTKNEYIKLFPDIAFALLAAGNEAAGRIWLLLRFLDSNGRGWISIEEAKEKLTQKTSSLKVCGWRQLRNLLNQGETVFWERDNGRIWLRSLTRVAQALHVSRLNMQPVALPISILLQSIGKVRAHFYATFHSSRTKPGKHKQPAKPVSRTVISEITHVQSRTQRRYEKLASVKKKHNYAIVGQSHEEKIEKYAWQHGRAFFELNDYKGLQGKPGSRYIAWQLPNSYCGPHKRMPKGNKKQINQALSDLFMQGMTGNGQSPFEKRYFANGRLAAKAHNRQQQETIYWYDYQLKLWHCLEAK